jgi:hypothetical protein
VNFTLLLQPDMAEQALDRKPWRHVEDRCARHRSHRASGQATGS